MIIGFSNHGIGRAQGALGYLLAKKTNQGPLEYVMGKKNRKGVVRNPAPVIVRGDRKLTGELINRSRHRWKYTSGVLSFSKGETITPQMEEKIMNEFERTAFAGLSPDQYSILWIRHAHTGREELHFIVPRVELTTGKSLNIAPPGPASRLLFDTLRSKINAEYGLSDPDDPSRRRKVSLPSHIAKLRKIPGQTKANYNADVRETFTRFIETKARNGFVRSRDDVIRLLRAAGFGIERQSAHFITVALPSSHERVRLRGHWYEADLNQANSPSTRQPEGPSPARVRVLANQLESMRKERAEYNKLKYPLDPTFHSNPQEVYERAGITLDPSGATPGTALRGERPPMVFRDSRFDRAIEQSDRNIRDLERACDRLGGSHRAIAGRLEQTITLLTTKNPTRQLYEKYGISTAPSKLREEHDLELEPEMER